MNVKECYEMMNANYDDAKNRLMNDRLIERFMLKYIDDESMRKFLDSLDQNDYESAFIAIHTLKGVAGNLAFSNLFETANQITEQLRSDKSAPDESLVQTLIKDYELIIKTLNVYKDEMK